MHDCGLDCAPQSDAPRTVTPTSPAPCIGMFDSGVGGLSILRAIRRRMPGVPVHYVADSAHAPYGELTDAAILDRSGRIASHLAAAGAKVIVVACNTATAVAVDSLRRTLAGTAIVGVEPGLRPALARSRSGHVGVMATDATLRSERFRALLQREAADRPVELVACTGLAAAIERGDLDDPPLLALVARYAARLREAGVDVVALGCTHYAFVRDAIERALGPAIDVLDTADAVAAQVARVWGDAQSTQAAAACRLETTGDPQQLGRFAARWLDFPTQFGPAPLVL